MPEILAPAGGREQLIAAVRCGADAVYLGAGSFNARRGAENFSGDALAEALSYCRVRNVAVHVAVNTLVEDSELPALLETADAIAEAGADAVIIQDLAAARLFRERWPEIPRHASTQLTVHDLDGAKLMADMGFTRVVLARELSLGEIEFITARCGMETEVFIHGALCMCMSGACYLSSILGGRSGNRGLCAQPCRLNFQSCTREYALSLKDMSHLKYLRELAGVGVASFKIEGRMKRPEYVAAAVTAARLALAGEPYDEETLRAVFSRSGFTDGYIKGRRDGDMFGVRQKEDVTAASSKLLGKLASLTRNERRSVPVDMKLECAAWGTELHVSTSGASLTVRGPVPERAVQRPLTAEIAGRCFEKTGGTPYYLRSFEAAIEDGLTLPGSAMNAIRREALEQLTVLRGRAPERDPRPVGLSEPVPYKAETCALRGRFQSAKQLTSPEAFDRIILPVRELALNPELLPGLGGKLIAELPALLFDGDRKRLADDLRRLQELGLNDALCENYYGVRLCRELGLRPHGGAGLNIMNTWALEEAKALGFYDVTLSFELAMSRVRELGGALPRGLVAFGRLPLMRFRNCPARGDRGCADCSGRPILRDRKNAEFPVMCDGRRFGTLLNSVPLYIGDRRTAPVDFLTLSFTTETREEAQRWLELFIRGGLPDTPVTRGLYWRKLL